MKTIGIDIGTTTISAVVLDHEEKKVVRSVTVDNGSFIDTGNAWERIQDAGKIIPRAKAVLDELIDAYPEIAGIGLTGQMHGIVYVDENGCAVSPLYTWQDQRGSLEEDGKSLSERIREKTGLSVSTGYGLVTHLYQAEHQLVPQEAAGLCTIPDYLGMALTGRKRPLMHISMAASIGFFDSAKGSFRADAFEAAGGDAAMLPDVTDEPSVLGQYRGYPVTAALGDNQASFLGSVGYEKNTLLLNVGTGGQISILSDQPFEAPGIEARPLAKNVFLLVGSSLCGGRAYAILEHFFRDYVKAASGEEKSQYGVMEKLARAALEKEEAGETEEMVVTTTFNGTRVDPTLRGSIENLSEDTFTPEGMTLGVIKGLVRELYEMYMQIYEGTGITVSHIIGSGNGVRRNAVLQQIATKMFGATLTPAAYQEEAACGAAISALR